MSSIETRVLNMKFNNQQFEAGCKKTLETLDSLKKALDFSGAAKGLATLGTQMAKISFDGMATGIAAIEKRFSAMGIVGMTVIQDLVHSAESAGKRIVSALTIDPIKTGFEEYTSQINAVQTILANTQSKGTTIDQVNDALDELNHYADKTIYNFTEMTRNIGTFTAAGVDLNTSVTAIKGIANLAAISGSTSQQASTAMYQLSQALAAGTVKLQDWNSVVNAGMGGQVFQDALKETAREHGIAVDDMIAKQGSFRESLTEGWITAEVLTDTLAKFTDETTELGRTATDAATKVKTFSQLWDTMKESVQSGWTETWEIIVGNFEEAKTTLTDANNFFDGIIQHYNDARNTQLRFWKDNGGRDKLINAIKIAVENLGKAIAPVKQAIQDFVPKVTGQTLLDFTDKLVDFAKGLQITDKQAEAVYKTLKALFNVFGTGGTVVGFLARYLLEFSKGVLPGVIDAVVRVADAVNGFFDEASRSAQAIDILQKPLNVLSSTFKAVTSRVDLVTFAGTNLKNIFYALKSVLQPISILFNTAFPKGIAVVVGDLASAITWLTQQLKLGEHGTQAYLSVLNLLSLMIDKIVIVVSEARKSLSPFSDLLKEAGGNVANLIQNIVRRLTSFETTTKSIGVSVAIVNNVIKAARSVLRGLINVIDIAANALIDAIPKGLLNSIQRLIEKVTDLRKSFKKFNTTFTLSKVYRVFRGLFSIVDLLLSSMKDVIDSVELNGNAFSSLANAALSLAAGLGDVVYNIVEFIKNTGAVKVLASGVFKIASTALTVIAKVAETIQKLTSKILRFIETNVPFQKMATAVKTGLTKLLDAFEQFGSAILGMFDAIKNSEGVQNLIDSLGRLWDSFATIASDTVTKATDNIAGFISAGAGSESMNNFVNLVSRLADALSRLIDNVSQGKNPFNDLFSGWDNIDAGPIAKVTAAYKFVEKTMKKGILATSITELSTAFDNFASSELVDIGHSISTFFSDLSITFESTDWQKVTNTITTAVTGIMVIRNLASLKKSVDSLTKIFGSIADIGKNINGLFTSWTAVAKTAQKALHVKMFEGIALGVVALASALWIVAQIPEDRLKSSIQTITIMLGELLGAVMILSSPLFNEKKMAGIGSAFIGMGLGLLAIIGAVKLITLLDEATLKQGMERVVAMLATYALAARLSGGAKKAGGTILAMAIGINLLVPAVIILGSIPLSMARKGMQAVVELMISFGLAARIAGQNKKAGGSFLAMAVAIDLLIPAIAILGSMDRSKLLQGGLAVVGVMESLALAARIAGKNGQSFGQMVGVVVEIAGVTAALYILSSLNMSSLISSASALSGVFLAIAGSTRLMKSIKITDLVTMGIMLATVTASLAYLSSFTNGETLYAAGTSLSLTLMAVSTAMLILSHTKDFKMDELLPLAILMGATLLECSVALAVLSQFGDPSSMLTSAAGLSLVLEAVAVAMTVLTRTGKMSWGDALTQVVLMAAVLAACTGALIALSNMGNVTALLPAAEGLGILLNSLAVALLVISKIKSLDPVTLIEVILAIDLILADMVAVIGTLGTIVDALGGADTLDTGIAVMGKIGEAIGKLLGGIIGGIAGGVIEGVASSLPALGQALTDFWNNAAGFFEGVSAIGSDNSVLQGVLNVTGAILAIVAGEFVTSLLNSPLFKLVTGGKDPLSGMLDMLRGFMNGGDSGYGIVNFIEDCRSLDKSDAEKAGIVGDVIRNIAVAASKIPNDGGWMGAIFGENNIGDFLSSLGDAMPSFKKYIEAIRGISEDDMKQSEEVMKTVRDIASAAKEIPNEGGFLADVLGDNGIGKFCKQLPSVGNLMEEYTTNIKGIDDKDIKTSKSVMSALSKIANAANNIPNSGGILADWVGDNTIAAFVGMLPATGKNFKSYIAQISDINGDDIDKSGDVMEQLAKIVKIANDIPNTGGFVGWLTGDNDIDDFGIMLSGFAESFGGYISKLNEIDFGEDGMARSNQLITTLRGLASLANDIGMLSGSGLSTLAGCAKTASEYIAGYFANISKITELDYSRHRICMSTLRDFLDLENELSVWNNIVASTQLNNIQQFGDSFRKFYNSIKDIDRTVLSQQYNLVDDTIHKLYATLTAYSSNFDELDSMSRTMQSFGIRLTHFYKDTSVIDERKFKMVCGCVDRLVDSLDGTKIVNESTIDSFSSNLAKISYNGITRFVNAFHDADSRARDAVNDFLNAARNAISSYYGLEDSMYFLGQNAAQGFANGISSKTADVIDEARYMADEALRAVQESLDSHSPSRETNKLGQYFGQGFANGILSLTGTVTSATYQMSDASKDALTQSMAQISEIVNGGLEIDPTIRPIVDMTDIAHGSSLVNSMFGATSYRLAAANARVTYDNVIQNGSRENELADSIYALRKDFRAMASELDDMKIVLDTGVMVGQLAKPMDKELGRLDVYKSRRG